MNRPVRLPKTKPTAKERSGKLRPGPQRRHTSGRSSGVSPTASSLLRLSRLVSRAVKSGSRLTGGASSRRNFTSTMKQRAVVNVSYSSSRVKGTFRAHGRYLERDSAAGKEPASPDDRLGLAKERPLDSLGKEWQESGDPRLFKIIISPERADANFSELANAVIGELESHTGAQLEWGGIVHRNTDHPHAHLMIRGINRQGDQFRIPKDVVRERLRSAVENSLTKSFGFRTIEDVNRQKLLEVTAVRVTSLDKSISKGLTLVPGNDMAQANPKKPLETARLKTLSKMELAKHDRGDWFVQVNFREQLQQMKDIQDRARTLFRSGVAISDPHAPMEYWSKSRKMIGRVLLNSEEERTGQFQTVFETIDGKIAIIRHDAPLRAAWQRGDLKPGNIIAIDSLTTDGRLNATSLGRDQDILKDERLLDNVLRRMRLLNLSVTEPEKGWVGEFARAANGRANQIGF